MDVDKPAVLITGACGGIGTALASHWDEHYHLLLLDKDSVALERLDATLSGDHTLIPFDLWSSPADCYPKLAQMIAEDYPALAGLAHLSAYFDNLRSLVYVSPENWLKTLQVNLTAPFWLTQAMVPLLRQCTAARIIFSYFDTLDRQAHYWHGFGVAQEGIVRLARDIAEESALYPEVGVVIVNPGWVDTALSRAVFPNGQVDWSCAADVVTLYDRAMQAPSGGLTRISYDDE